MPKYQHDDFGDVQDHIFAKGIITAVDSEYDTADVTVEGYESGSDVPLFYHCEPDSEERSNGAIEGAAAGFSAGTEDDPTDGDEVIVMLEVNGPPVRIVGFVDGIKSCMWEPFQVSICNAGHLWRHAGADSSQFDPAASHKCPTMAALPINETDPVDNGACARSYPARHAWFGCCWFEVT